MAVDGSSASSSGLDVDTYEFVPEGCAGAQPGFRVSLLYR